MTILMDVLTWTFSIVGAMVMFYVALVAWLFLSDRIENPPRRKKEPGFEYIYIEDDGSARELDEDERIYLTTEFHGNDGARPYRKSNYEARTPDFKLRGYLERRLLPQGIPIKAAPDQE